MDERQFKIQVSRRAPEMLMENDPPVSAAVARAIPLLMLRALLTEAGFLLLHRIINKD